MKPGESLEHSDPFGLVRSSGIASDDRSVRFVLSVPSSQKTRIAKAMTASGGGGVNHIALDCADIFATVAKWRANGVPFVNVSPNYYDDIVARLDIDPGLVERMKSLGILYDRNANGEFFHAYSVSFADRFFFELTQRAGAYAGYGALNAPARMAAQTLAEGEER
jgi:4-hydroxyphenylpyruvate dioxygenase